MEGAMNIIRLGDRIEDAQRPMPYGKSFPIAESLAQKVFNPSPDRKDINNYYVQSQPLAEKPPFFFDLPDGTPDLGEYEVKILGKLLSPQRPLLVIVGPMGSGKTTLKDFAALSLLKNRKHCSNCNPPKDRLIAHIDFNEHISLNDLKPNDLNKQVFILLCEEMQSRLNIAQIITPEMEYLDFWKVEIEEFKQQKSSSLAFRKIISQTSDQSILNFELKTPESIDRRQRLFYKIKKNSECYLDYLIRLWKYIIQKKYCRVQGCGIILFDNLDRVHPTVQRKVIDIIHTHAKIGGPTFLVLVRPETFDNNGLGTGIIDVEDQKGPSPFEIIKKRLDEFCKNPEVFFDSKTGLPKEQFDLISQYICRVRKTIHSDSYQVFQKFIESTCGQSIRIGYLIAQNLFYANLAEMQNEKISVYDLVRLCIRGDTPQLKWNPARTTEHLFRVSSLSSDGLLIKPRILRYLGRSNRDRRKLGEISSVLMGFNYDNTLITSAINDLMQISHQLVRSNGFDYYDTKNELLTSGHNIRITDIGKRYSDYLMCNLDYVQETMLDTFVDGDHFPLQIGFGYIADKFRLIYYFLDEIRAVDRKETEQFVEKWGDKGYKDAFGDHLISLDMIHGIYPSILRVLRALSHSDDLEDLLTDFESLVLSVENDNFQLLDIQVVSAIN
jgi:hypothetical protein